MLVGACQGRVEGECAYGPLSEDALLLLGKVDRHVVSVSGRVSQTVIAECYSTFLAAAGVINAGVTEWDGCGETLG